MPRNLDTNLITNPDVPSSYEETLIHVVTCIKNTKQAEADADIFLSDETASDGKRVKNALLFFRGISCTNRYVMIVSTGQFIAGAFFGDWAYTNHVIHMLGVSFFITDGFLTVLSSHDSVAVLCKDFNLPRSIRKHVQLIRDGKFSATLLIMGLIGMGNAWFKGYLGTVTIARDFTSLITQHPPAFLNMTDQVLGHVVGFSSSICFYAFQLKGLALLNNRIYRALSENLFWAFYYQKNKS